MVVEHKVRLIYPPHLLNQPLLYGLIRQFDLQTNILEARVEAAEGWLLLAVRGEEIQVHQGLDWLRQQGVRVEVLGELEAER
jgi:ABC-type methionine transport system ATPase subunit